MDPITVSHLVQDRTQDLQRIADQVRQERSLRSDDRPAASTAGHPSPDPPKPVAAPAASGRRSGGCAPAEPAA